MAKPHIVLKSTMAGEGMRASLTAHEGASFDINALKAWTPRRGSSADADLLPDLATLVSRARDADRNNGVAKGGVQTILDNVVGTGLRLSARPNYRLLGKTKEWAAEWARDVEDQFHAWWWSTACHAGDTLNGDQILEQALRANLMNGDAIALPLWLPERGDGYATKLQLIEGDRLSNPNGAGDTVNRRAGIEFDGYGMPLAYNFRTSYPADISGMAMPTWERVTRRTDFGRLRVIHYFDQERSGQSRGKPLLTAVMMHFKQANRYIGAELDAAVANALIAGIIETPLENDDIVELFSKDHAAYLKAREEYAVRMQSGSMMPLFPGDKLQPFIPARPAAAFGNFLDNLFKFVAVSMDMPREFLLKDFSQMSYSAMRGAALEAWRAFNRRRDRVGTGFMDPVFGLFLEEKVNDGTIDAPDFYEYRAAYTRCRWIGPGKGWVDPVKEAQASQIRIDGGISTLEDECAEQGKDWREVMEQRATEEAERVRLGLPDHSASRASNPVQSALGDQSADQPPNAPQQQGAQAA